MLAFFAVGFALAQGLDFVPPLPVPVYQRTLYENEEEVDGTKRLVERRIVITKEFRLPPSSKEPQKIIAGQPTLGRGERKDATLRPQFQPNLRAAATGVRSAINSIQGSGTTPADAARIAQEAEKIVRAGKGPFEDAVIPLRADDHMTSPNDVSVTWTLGHFEHFEGLLVEVIEVVSPGPGEREPETRQVSSEFFPVVRHLIPSKKPFEIKVNRRADAGKMLQDGFNDLPEGAPGGAFHRHTLEPFIRPASVDRATQPEGGKPPSRSPFTEGIPQYWLPLEKTKVYGEFGDWVDKRFKNRSTPVVSGDGFTKMAFDGAPLNWTTGAGSTLAGEEAYGFPIGAVWLPSDPAYQAMVGLESFAFVPAVGISDSALMPQEQMMFRAACLEFNKKPPEPGIAYRPVFLNDTGLTMLAQKMVPVSRDVRLVQTAMWAYMDHAGPMEVLERLTGGISAAAYVRALKLIDESAGLSPAMLKDEDVLHPVLMSVYGLPEEELNWFMALYARSAPGAIAKALERPGANLQALYDKDTPESEAKDFVMNLGRLLISGGDPVKKSVVEFLHKSYPSARYELFRNDFMGFALAAAAGSEDKALADRAKSFIEKSGAPAVLP